MTASRGAKAELSSAKLDDADVDRTPANNLCYYPFKYIPHDNQLWIEQRATTRLRMSRALSRIGPVLRLLMDALLLLTGASPTWQMALPIEL